MTDSVKPLNQFSLALLSGLLAAGEWYETPGQLYRAGDLLDEVLPEIPLEPRLPQKFTAAGYPIAPTDIEIQEHNAAHKTWASTTAPWRRDPTPKEVEAIKACVKKFADQKKLGGSIHLRPLLKLAALKPED